MNEAELGPNPSKIIEDFNREGFYLAKGVFNQNEISELKTEFHWIVDQLQKSGESVNAIWDGAATQELAHGDDQILHTHNVHRYSKGWLDAFTSPKFLWYARALLGDDVILHHSKLFQKPAEQGAPFPMHQDWAYFPTELDSMIAGIIHVSEASDEMGCLRVWPGSHRNGRLADSHGRDGGQLKDFPINQAIPIESEPGDVVFFHYLTVHGSMPNRSQQTRKTVLVQMYSGHDRVTTGIYGDHIDEQLALSGRNYRISRSLAGERKGAL